MNTCQGINDASWKVVSRTLVSTGSALCSGGACNFCNRIYVGVALAAIEPGSVFTEHYIPTSSSAAAAAAAGPQNQSHSRWFSVGLSRSWHMCTRIFLSLPTLGVFSSKRMILPSIASRHLTWSSNLYMLLGSVVSAKQLKLFGASSNVTKNRWYNY